MKHPYSSIIIILLATALAACSTMETTLMHATPSTTAVGDQVQEIMPGLGLGLGLGSDPDRTGAGSRRGNPGPRSRLRREPQRLQRALV